MHAGANIIRDCFGVTKAGLVIPRVLSVPIKRMELKV